MEWYIFELYNWLGNLFKDIRVLIMFFNFVLFLVCWNFYEVILFINVFELVFLVILWVN